MVELLFVACLAGDPASCRENSLIFTDLTPRLCLLGAEPRLAEWAVTHPRHEIKSWRCRVVDPNRRDA